MTDLVKDKGVCDSLPPQRKGPPPPPGAKKKGPPPPPQPVTAAQIVAEHPIVTVYVSSARYQELFGKAAGRGASEADPIVRALRSRFDFGF